MNGIIVAWSVLLLSNATAYFFPESEPSLLEFKPFGNGPLVGGFVYRGCQSERLYGSYVFGDRDG